ncbi:7 transmembrane sweet-taste receptor of 3 GCPR-domain-containing protein [Helicostylum pulchrum]|nr:7 transmembrane sweet-taste receptor of 3 GCPR-domain-containing protein [Helicostylum pulchrum]
MGWKSCTLIYTNSGVGRQVSDAMYGRRIRYGTAMERIAVYGFEPHQIKRSLDQLIATGNRIVLFADTDPISQIRYLQYAKEAGVFGKGWAWITMNDISPGFEQEIGQDDHISEYDGLMFVSGLWDLTGEPRYDSLNQIWKSKRVPEDYTRPENWESDGLSFNGPSAYSCTELLALGLRRALDSYDGGRSVALSDLRNRTFNSSQMVPSFYNLDYTGPAGQMVFNSTGDLRFGYFDISYMKDGKSYPYVKVKLDEFEFRPNTTIIYPGGTTEKPVGTIARHEVNPNIYRGYGLFAFIISLLGFASCIIMVVLIFLFRHLKPIMAASPFFCYLQLIGLAMIYVGLILCIGKPTIVKCVLLQLFLAIGFSLTMGSMIAKNYRVYRIFQNVFTIRTTRLKSYYLVRMVGLIMALAVLPLIVWYAIFPMEVIEYDLSTITFCWLCSYPSAKVGNWNNFTISELAVAVWCFLLVAVSTFLAFKTRNISSTWSETNQIAYVSYNTGIASLIASPAFFLPLDSYLVSFYLKISSALFAVSFSLAVLYFPKFFVIFRVILKETTKFSLYRMNADSEVELTKPSYSSSLEDNLNLNMVAKNLFDFTVQAHEGVLPVKKMARFEFFSIWELKHIILLPMKQSFVLTDKSKKNATLHSYTDCEIIPSEEASHHSFRVRTDVGLVFLFQVSDREALERWVKWFKGGKADEATVKKDQDSPVPLDQLSLPKLQSTTFGVGNDSGTTSSIAQPSMAAHSSFYTPSAFSNISQQIQDGSQSALHNPLLSSNNLENNMSGINGGSFGVVQSSWQRYS